MNTNFELILLKNISSNSEFFGKVMPIMKPRYFSELGSQELFKLIQNYYAEYSEIPSTPELVAMIRSVPNATTREEIAKSLKAVHGQDVIDNVEFLCNETVSYIKDALYLEALQIGSEGLMEKDDKKKLKAQEILEERSKITIDSDLGLDFDDIQTMIDYYQERRVGILTQHKELNKRLGAGFMPKTLSMLLAAPGVGKSLMKTDLISGMIKNGKNVLLVSMEMQDKEIMKRVHANAMNLPINSLIDLSKTEGELNQIKKERPIITKEDVLKAYNKMKTEGKSGKLFVKEFPAGSFTALMLENLLESFKIEKGIEFDVVFLDYLGIMASDRLSPSAGLYSYIKSIGEEVRAVAQKKDVAIVSSSQLNRGAIQGDVQEADNSNIADSMGTAMTADLMIFLLQNEEMKERGEMVLKCTKNRFTGRTDTWLMNIDYDHMRFSDMLTEENVSATQDILDNNNSLDQDFGIITAKKMEEATEYADNEVKNIMRESGKQLLASEPETSKDTQSEIEDIYKELGI